MNFANNIAVVGSAWLGRIISACISLISIRVLLEGLGSDRFAVFIVLNSLLAWYTLADFGVGSSLQNYISEQRAKGKDYSVYIAAVALIAMILFVFTMASLFFASPYLGELILGKFDFLSAAEKSKLVFISGALFTISSLGGIVFKIWYAEIRGYLSNIVPAMAALLGLFAAWLVMQSGLENKLLYGLVVFVAPSSAIAIIIFSRRAVLAIRKEFYFEHAIFMNLMRRAGRFWLLYLMHAAVVNCDYIIMSQFLTAQEIVSYSIATRVFGFSAFFYTSLYAAQWPHFTESIANGDWASVNKSLAKSILFSSILMAVFTAFVSVYMPSLVTLLSPDESLVIPYYFIWLLGGYHVVIAWVHGFGIPLQSMSDVKTLLIWTPIQAILSISLQIALVPSLGVYGITLGMMISFLVTMAWVLPRRVACHSKIIKVLA
jgi:O-antigen/teichoic acid export membrane protein